MLPELPGKALRCADGWPLRHCWGSVAQGWLQGAAMGLVCANSKLLWPFHSSGQQLLCMFDLLFLLFHPCAFSGCSGSLHLPFQLHSQWQKLLGPLSAAFGLSVW